MKNLLILIILLFILFTYCCDTCEKFEITDYIEPVINQSTLIIDKNTIVSTYDKIIDDAIKNNISNKNNCSILDRNISTRIKVILNNILSKIYKSVHLIDFKNNINNIKYNLNDDKQLIVGEINTEFSFLTIKDINKKYDKINNSKKVTGTATINFSGDITNCNIILKNVTFTTINTPDNSLTLKSPITLTTRVNKKSSSIVTK